MKGRRGKGSREEEEEVKKTLVLGPPIHRHTSLGLAACSLGIWGRFHSEDALAASSTKQNRKTTCQLRANSDFPWEHWGEGGHEHDQREVREKGNQEQSQKCRNASQSCLQGHFSG